MATLETLLLNTRSLVLMLILVSLPDVLQCRKSSSGLDLRLGIVIVCCLFQLSFLHFVVPVENVPMGI